MGKERIEVNFGTYEGDPIQWIVLKKTDQKALLLSKHCLFAKPYHDEFDSVTWEDCSLRKWLNQNFYHDAFTQKEQNAILLTKIRNRDNPEHGTNGGNDTEDKIFLLSIDEVYKYLPSKRVRVATFPGGELTWWWLRSPGYSDSNAAGVWLEGSVNLYGSDFFNDHGIRLALWVDLNSDIFLLLMPNTTKRRLLLA